MYTTWQDEALWVCRFVKDADKAIIAELKSAGRLVDSQTIVHSYPFCWRSETPLIYKAGPDPADTLALG